MQEVEYIGPFDEVEVDGVGLVHPGEPVQVADEIAGRPPKGHRADGDDYDPGFGLLAQTTNWRRPKRKPAAKKAPAKKAPAKAAATPPSGPPDDAGDKSGDTDKPTED